MFCRYLEKTSLYERPHMKSKSNWANAVDYYTFLLYMIPADFLSKEKALLRQHKYIPFY